MNKKTIIITTLAITLLVTVILSQAITINNFEINEVGGGGGGGDTSTAESKLINISLEEIKITTTNLQTQSLQGINITNETITTTLKIKTRTTETVKGKINYWITSPNQTKHKTLQTPVEITQDTELLLNYPAPPNPERGEWTFTAEWTSSQTPKLTVTRKFDFYKDEEFKKLAILSVALIIAYLKIGRQ